MLLHPEVAARTCADCQTYLYDDKPDRFALEPVRRGGERVKRIPLVQLPMCQWCPKVPEGAPPVPASAVELSDRNAGAVLHYRRCKAVGRFPVDGIVEEHAAVVAHVEAEAELAREQARYAQGPASLVAALPRVRR